jgi:hypothetical protein
MYEDLRLGQSASLALPAHPEGPNAAEHAYHAEDPQDYAAHDQEDHARYEEAEADYVGCHDLRMSRGSTTPLLPRRREHTAMRGWERAAAPCGSG